MGKQENFLQYLNSFLPRRPILDTIPNTINSESSLIFYHSGLMKNSRQEKGTEKKELHPVTIISPF
jgi:hypothetical protein